MRSLTGDPTTDAMLPDATRLIWAVRELNADEVALVLQSVDANVLAVVLAAMVPDDMPPRDLLMWLQNPEEYLRLRRAGVGCYGASNVIRLAPKVG